MFEGECSYENYQTKLSPRQEENRTGYERLQNKLSHSPNEADLNKRRSPDKQGTNAIEQKTLHKGRHYQT